MNIKRNTKQGGWTLVELAVVMVIIGILLSAILKGQDLINNARAKSVLSGMKDLEAKIWAYYDRQGRFPGDCDNSGLMGLEITVAVAQGAGTPAAADLVTTALGTATDPNTLACDTGSGTGVAAADVDAPVADLRIEHLLDWTASSDTSTEHAFDGNYHLAHVGDQAATETHRNAIIVYNIPQWVGEMIDSNIDGSVDGEAGRVRYIDTNVAASAADLEGTTWPARTVDDLEVAVGYYFDEVAPVP